MKLLRTNSRGARATRIAAICVSCILGCVHPSRARAQGTTTGTIRGTVTAVNGGGVEAARIQVLNTATGVTLHSRVRHGRFLIQGLEIGRPYVIEVRHIGFTPQRTTPLFLTLGEPLEVHVLLQPVARGLDTLVVTDASVAANGATAVVIRSSLLQRLPTLNRNFQDFLILAPQISTKVGSGRTGLSAAGANLRFNGFLINGADERFVNGSVSAASSIGRSIPFDAVKEYSVLVAPYDVRYGDFAGALVNTVTQSGTNTLSGSTFANWRNDRLSRAGDLARSEPYDRLQYGVSLGGPVLPDRVHFFVATEWQRLTRPAPGPYVGQPATRKPAVPVSESDLARMEDALLRLGLTPGSGGPVVRKAPLQNLFARLDAAIPRWNTRATAFVSDARSIADQFSRAETFSLSSYAFASDNGIRIASVQLNTDLPRVAGGHNELLVSHTSDWTSDNPTVRQPLVRVAIAGDSVVGGSVTLNAGTAEEAHGRFGRGRSIKVKDELSLPWGMRHILSLGVQVERFRVLRGGVRGGYGTWTFANLDSLDLGVAERFDLRKDFGSASVPLTGGQYAAFVGDEWRVNDRVSFTMGVRADRLNIDGRAPYNAMIDSIFGRRTDDMPGPRVHISPRLGFAWDLSGTGRERLRGGLGLFTGRPPLAWFVPALANYGEGIGVLSCGSRTTDNGPPPAFEPDYRAPPTQCATGSPISARPFWDVTLLAQKLRIAQSLRASLAYDRQLPWKLISSSEILVSRYVSDFAWQNLNLRGPQAVDPYGRVLYGTIGGNGTSVPALRSPFTEVIELGNTSKNYSYQLSTRVERQFSERVGVTASYTYSRTRDVQSPSRVNQTGIAMWADARALSGRHEQQRRETSLNDLPHRVVAGFGYTAPWPRWSTEASFYYVGESGSPFTYLATGTGLRGDLNADGSNANDPIYVPRNASDPNEILFSGLGGLNDDNSPAAQAGRVAGYQAALDGFIERTPCLRRQRGQIAKRNSCRDPWSHTTVAAVRQAIPIGTRPVELQLDAFNVLNLLNGAWGRYRVAAPRVLQHVAQTTGPPETSRPIFQFNTATEWTTLPESAFQLQIALRYRF